MLNGSIPQRRKTLSALGIYARPELYEFSGACSLETAAGIINVAGAAPYGLAVPSTSIDFIVSVDLSKIQKIVFIENKTNYDEYILSELHQDELVVYHGGFLSPQKRKFFAKIAQSIPQNAAVFFWADIDLGGFLMFQQLQHIIPRVRPMRMSGEDVASYVSNGLQRSDYYLKRLKAAFDKNEFPVFNDAIEAVLKYGVTIEQEAFLK